MYCSAIYEKKSVYPFSHSSNLATSFYPSSTTYTLLFSHSTISLWQNQVANASSYAQLLIILSNAPYSILCVQFHPSPPINSSLAKTSSLIPFHPTQSLMLSSALYTMLIYASLAFRLSIQKCVMPRYAAYANSSNPPKTCYLRSFPL